MDMSTLLRIYDDITSVTFFRMCNGNMCSITTATKAMTMTMKTARNSWQKYLFIQHFFLSDYMAFFFPVEFRLLHTFVCIEIILSLTCSLALSVTISMHCELSIYSAQIMLSEIFNSRKMNSNGEIVCGMLRTANRNATTTNWSTFSSSLFNGCGGVRISIHVVNVAIHPQIIFSYFSFFSVI